MVFDPRSPTGDLRVTLKEEPEITINITANRIECGKTTVAAIISQALHNAGFKSIKIDCKDGDIEFVAEENITEGIVTDSHVIKTKINIIDN